MNEKEIILEEYKLYVDTSIKASVWRQSANNFFLVLNSTILAFSGYLSTLNAKNWFFIIPFMGIIISYLWLKTIKSYRQLNSGKFKLIHEIEKKLPIALFYKEWEYLGRGETKDYVRISKVESAIPILFIILYLIVFLLAI